MALMLSQIILDSLKICIGTYAKTQKISLSVAQMRLMEANKSGVIFHGIFDLTIFRNKAYKKDDQSLLCGIQLRGRRKNNKNRSVSLLT